MNYPHLAFFLHNKMSTDINRFINELLCDHLEPLLCYLPNIIIVIIGPQVCQEAKMLTTL